MNMKRVLSVLSFVMAIVFAITSLLLPPQGVIDSSVLVLVAQLLLLCATFLGVESYVNIIKQLKP